MKYYSEETVKGLLEQMDSHFVKYLENLPCIEIEEPHGRLGDLDKVAGRMHNNSKSCRENGNIESAEIWEHAEQEVRLQGTVIEASTSPSGFCNTEGCDNSKPDMSKAQNHICPYYQGVCSLDENILCYCEHHYEMCEKFIKVIKGRKK